MGAERKPKNVTSYELDVHINYLITYKAKEIKPEIKKAGTAMRLRWDQTLMPPPSLARSAVIRRAGEAADETIAEDRAGANSQKLCQLTSCLWLACSGGQGSPTGLYTG